MLVYIQMPDLAECFQDMYRFVGADRQRGGSLARTKLARLSPPQIGSLANDIHWEMTRRQGQSRLPAALVDVGRLEARERIAQLSDPNFKHLVIDMCCEFERRQR